MKMKNVAGPESTNTTLKIRGKIHSECALMAWVCQNALKIVPGISLIPYLTCSKLHCFACSLWMTAFNTLEDPVLPRIAFDGSHGGLKTGWRPPSMNSEDQGTIIQQLITALDTEFGKQKHLKESSASTTSSEPPKLDVPVTPLEPSEVAIAQRIRDAIDLLIGIPILSDMDNSRVLNSTWQTSASVMTVFSGRPIPRNTVAAKASLHIHMLSKSTNARHSGNTHRRWRGGSR
jgi:hypothetical protein